MKRFGKRQKGFTLIELLVVVGIMAALAAIIVPNVARFVGSGRSEGAAAEGDAVQAGIDAAMADLGLKSGDVNDNLGAAVTDFSTYAVDGGTTMLYPEYIRIGTAKYGSDGTANSGWLIDDTGKVTLPSEP